MLSIYLHKIIKNVEKQIKNLNHEFRLKRVEWTILDHQLVGDKLEITIQINKHGAISHHKYLIWANGEFSYSFKKENESEARGSLKEEIVKAIATETYGGPVLGTSLAEEEWEKEHFHHLNLVAAT